MIWLFLLGLLVGMVLFVFFVVFDCIWVDVVVVVFDCYDVVVLVCECYFDVLVVFFGFGGSDDGSDGDVFVDDFVVYCVFGDIEFFFYDCFVDWVWVVVVCYWSLEV